MSSHTSCNLNAHHWTLQMVEIDSATMMITLTQKAGETHTREVSVTAHEPTFVAYTTRTAGSVEDQTGVEVSSYFHGCSFSLLYFVSYQWYPFMINNHNCNSSFFII